MISSFMFDYGLMFHGKVGKDLTLTLGATYDQQIKLRGSQTIFIRSIEAGDYSSASAAEYLIDTVWYQTDNKASLTMPHGVGFGITLQKNNRWTLGADFNWAQWSAFERNGVNQGLQDSWSVAVGGEYIPVSTTLSSYWTKMSYRLGGFYEQTYLNINGHSINKLGVTAGVTLPVPKTLSRVNLSLEVGKCGTKSDNLIQEGYVNFTLGVSIFERWFVKRMYR